MGAGGINSEYIRDKIMRAYYRKNRVADDDTLLLNEVWKMSGWDGSKTLLQNLRVMPSPETIRRTRQKLVAEGLIKPSATSTDRRYNSWKRARKALGYEEI